MSDVPTVVSLATASGRYPEGLGRLRESLVRARFGGRTRFWEPGDFPAGCPPHVEVPFAFKPYGLRAVGEEEWAGAVLWLDAACVVVRDLGPLFGAIVERGVVVFRNARHRVGEWASDDALEALGLDRELALGLPEVDAAAVGLDLRHPVGRAFLDGWLAAAQGVVAFRGSREPALTVAERLDIKWNRHRRASADPRVRGHRHDQTVAGVLAHRLGIVPREKGLQKHSSRARGIRPSSVVVVDRDLGDPRRPLRPVAGFRRDRYLGLPVGLGRFLARLVAGPRAAKAHG